MSMYYGNGMIIERSQMFYMIPFEIKYPKKQMYRD